MGEITQVKIVGNDYAKPYNFVNLALYREPFTLRTKVHLSDISLSFWHPIVYLEY